MNAIGHRWHFVAAFVQFTVLLFIHYTPHLGITQVDIVCFHTILLCGHKSMYSPHLHTKHFFTINWYFEMQMCQNYVLYSFIPIYLYVSKSYNESNIVTLMATTQNVNFNIFKINWIFCFQLSINYQRSRQWTWNLYIEFYLENSIR